MTIFFFFFFTNRDCFSPIVLVSKPPGRWKSWLYKASCSPEVSPSSCSISSSRPCRRQGTSGTGEVLHPHTQLEDASPWGDTRRRPALPGAQGGSLCSTHKALHKGHGVSVEGAVPPARVPPALAPWPAGRRKVTWLSLVGTTRAPARLRLCARIQRSAAPTAMPPLRHEPERTATKSMRHSGLCHGCSEPGSTAPRRTKRPCP